MKREKLISFLVILFLLGLSVLLLLYIALTLEIDSELRMIGEDDAVRIESGPLYDLFSQTAKQCGLKKTPELYIAYNLPFNASYVSLSSTPFGLRPGKIEISEEYVVLFNDEEIKTVFAHEMGHKEMDWKQALSSQRFQAEIDADRFAVTCLGRASTINLLKKLDRLILIDPEKLPLTAKQKMTLKKRQIDIREAALENHRRRIEALQKQ